VADTGLQSWMRTLLSYVRSGDPDLTNRQMALLLLVYLKPGPHTVRGLAKALNVSKPVVTRALNRLGALGYLRRQRDDADRRNIFVAPTREGADFLEHFKSLISGSTNGQGNEKRSQRSESREPAHA
jgi:DNA-binding MarR family transcriptional regulator